MARRIDITVTAIELEAIRRALAGLAAEEAYRRVASNRGPTRIHAAVERVYSKIFEKSPHDTPVRTND
jgi:hypothetical protein